MVFADTGDIVSGGNFHGAPIAIAADLLAAALVPLATISERRTDRLVDPTLSGLPAFLTRDGGLRVGLMLAQVTAAAVASEMKIARASGRRRHDSDVGEQGRPRQHEHDGGAEGGDAPSSRAREVVAIEILCACQAIDLLAPLDDVAAARSASTRSCDRACRRSTTIARRRPISSRSRN